MTIEDRTFRAEFGTRIKEARKELELNQSEFAARIGVARDTLGRYERGELSPSVDVVARIVHELSDVVDANWLLAGAQKDPDHPQVIRVGSMGMFWGIKEGKNGDRISASLYVDDIVRIIGSCARFGNLQEGDYSKISHCIETLTDWVRRAGPAYQLHFSIPVFKGVFKDFPSFPFNLPRASDTEPPTDLPESDA